MKVKITFVLQSLPVSVNHFLSHTDLPLGSHVSHVSFLSAAGDGEAVHDTARKEWQGVCRHAPQSEPADGEPEPRLQQHC